MPITYKTIPIQQPERFRCDRCMHDFEDMRSSVHIQHTFGYDAPVGWDGEAVDMVICEACLLALAQECGIVPHVDVRSESITPNQGGNTEAKQKENFYGFSIEQSTKSSR